MMKAPPTGMFRRTLDELNLPPFAAAKPAAPVVVAVEGPNGTGKTTLCRWLATALNAPQCLGTDEAWFTDAFKVRMIRDADWLASALFFLSGCLEQMRVLRTRPEPLIIMDRSMWSTLAVHGCTAIERLEQLLAMLRPAASTIRVPACTLVLEAGFETCQARIAKKGGIAQRLDELTASSEFYAREHEFYRWLGRQRQEFMFLNVDQGGPDEIGRAALEVLRNRFPC